MVRRDISVAVLQGEESLPRWLGQVGNRQCEHPINVFIIKWRVLDICTDFRRMVHVKCLYSLTLVEDRQYTTLRVLPKSEQELHNMERSLIKTLSATHPSHPTCSRSPLEKTAAPYTYVIHQLTINTPVPTKTYM